MIEFSHVIADPEGIHARPAGLLVKQAKECQASVTLIKDGKSADAKRIFAVMGLAAKRGETLTVRIEGEDEQAAAALIRQFLQENL